MFTLPSLPYKFDALEPHVDAQTMEVHYSKHHQGYTDKLNTALEGLSETNPEVKDQAIEAILGQVSKLPTAVRNNAGGFFNHNLFWQSMAPESSATGEAALTGTALSQQLTDKFGGLDAFKEQFAQAATGVFGSGWAWLIVSNGQLEITTTPNQDNPLMDVAEHQGRPVLGLDVWEHAYYLKYQNRRPDYITAWWNIVNWAEVSSRYDQATV